MDHQIGKTKYKGTPHLSPMETVTVVYMLAGLSNKEIANALHLSTKTIKYHLGNAFPKLGVTSRVGAVAKFYRGELPEEALTPVLKKIEDLRQTTKIDIGPPIKDPPDLPKGLAA